MKIVNILAPELPESVANATILSWRYQVGDYVQRDSILAELETDKVVLEIPASESGILQAIFQEEGSVVTSRQQLASLEIKEENLKTFNMEENIKKQHDKKTGPAVRRLLQKNDLTEHLIETEHTDRITKKDIEHHLNKMAHSDFSPPQQKIPATVITERSVERVPMSCIRKRIAERLLYASQSMAMLTTFNEVNMQPIQNLRKQYQDEFRKQHGVGLGLMSFYVKAVTEALKRYPEINASIEDDAILYHNYCDINVAVSTPRGLVTPILQDTENMSFAEIETKVKSLAIRGKEGKLTLEELHSGTFTITNGGVFGSLMSTPLINPPQSAILGMHAIQERPVAEYGSVTILPMMYVALSYDHRLIDGESAVRFLLEIKKQLEEPTRLLLQL